MVQTIFAELFSAFHYIRPEEIARARNMLKGILLMNLESQSLMCEDLCRCVYGGGGGGF